MNKIKKTILTLVALLAVTTQAWAQTDVSTFADLQTALNAGNDVKLTANIQFTTSITISGSKKITIDGNGKKMSGPSTCAFIISSDNTLAIKNATIDNFDRNAGGGAIRNNGTLVLDGCTVSNNHTDGSGQGGGAIENQGTLYASNTTFSGNYSSEIGGAINNYMGNLYLSGCTFTNNYTTSTIAKYGGAIGNNSSKTLVLVNCTFSGNKYGGSNGTAGDLGLYRTPGTYTIAGCTGIAIDGATLTTYQYGTATLDYSDLSAISFTYDQSDTPIAPAGTAVTFTRGTGDDSNKWTMDGGMPAGNVIVEPEYYPQATVTTGGVTAATGVQATTDAELVTIDATKLTGATTLKYIVTTDATPAPAYDATGWTSDIPTAANITTVGLTYVWYYPVGTDDEDPAKTYSDGDICKEPISVNIQPAPTYAVTFADGIDEADKWTASPNEGVTKGTTINVTYTGSKKVLGVKAEKKSGAEGKTLAEATVGMLVGSDGKTYAAADKDNLPDGVNAVALVCYVSDGHGLALALTDESGKMTWNTAKSTCSGKTPAVTGCTWKLATKDEWDNMITAAGGFSALRDGFSSVGGTNMLSGSDDAYWSSTATGVDCAWSIICSNGNWYDDYADDYTTDYVRACLAF